MSIELTKRVFVTNSVHEAMNSSTPSHETRMKRNRKKCFFLGIVVIAVIIIYFFPSFKFSAEWKMYHRDWVMVEDVATKGFTYMTYNILNPGWAGQNKYKDCGADWLSTSIRQERILKEIETVSPDVLCVQEIDQIWYDNYWYPTLSARGYDGVAAVTMVKNQLNAGQAIFWRKSIFVKNMDEYRHFHDLFKFYIDKSVKGIEGEELYESYTRRNLIQVAELQEVASGSKVIVGCAHFAHRQTLEPSIQVLHAGLAFQYMDKLSQQQGTKAMIMSGDLNTPPQHPAYEFIRTGELNGSLKRIVKETTNLINMDDPHMKKFAVEVMNLVPDAFHHDLRLRSAFYTVMGREPLATFLGDMTLDYIWYTSNYIEVSGIMKEPDNLITDVIPNRKGNCFPLFGSDHLPVVAKLYFKTGHT